jgi:hypothetical protein
MRPAQNAPARHPAPPCSQLLGLQPVASFCVRCYALSCSAVLYSSWPPFCFRIGVEIPLFEAQALVGMFATAASARAKISPGPGRCGGEAEGGEGGSARAAGRQWVSGPRKKRGVGAVLARRETPNDHQNPSETQKPCFPLWPRGVRSKIIRSLVFSGPSALESFLRVDLQPAAERRRRCRQIPMEGAPRQLLSSWLVRREGRGGNEPFTREHKARPRPVLFTPSRTNSNRECVSSKPIARRRGLWFPLYSFCIGSGLLQGVISLVLYPLGQLPLWFYI